MKKEQYHKAKSLIGKIEKLKDIVESYYVLERELIGLIEYHKDEERVDMKPSEKLLLNTSIKDCIKGITDKIKIELENSLEEFEKL